MTMKLSDKDLENLKKKAKTTPIHKWLKAKANLNFQVGDILLKTKKTYCFDTSKYEWKLETISKNNEMPRRFVYVYEDEFGIGFIRELMVSTGELGHDDICLASLDFDNVKFDVDPEYAERVLLDSSFDIQEMHKKSLENRKVISKVNRTLGVRLSKLSKMNEVIASLTKNSTIYLSNDFTGREVRECEFLSCKKVTIKDKNEFRNGYPYKNIWNETYGAFFDSDHYYEVDLCEYYGHGNHSSHTGTYNAFDLFKNVLFKTKPAKEETT